MKKSAYNAAVYTVYTLQGAVMLVNLERPNEVPTFVSTS
jgi:hypothetical protein